MNSEAPILSAYRNEDQLLTLCPHCHRQHAHSTGDGHRIAHCEDKDSPFHNSGYVLQQVSLRAYAKYRQELIQKHRDRQPKQEGLVVVDLHDLLSTEPESQWLDFPWMGEWFCNSESLTLTLIPEDYEIDLEDINNIGELTDWIFHLAEKVWMEQNPRWMWELVNAFDDLFGKNLTRRNAKWPSMKRVCERLCGNIEKLKQGLMP